MTLVLANEFCSYEEEIRKSRFLVRAMYAESSDDAVNLIEKYRDPAATHNCWAFVSGNCKRCSDDGEPSGTAGRPILSAIEYSGIDHVAVLVTRYFGGIKLGAGGLIRAYSGVASRCLGEADIEEIVEYSLVKVMLKFEYTGRFYSILKRFGALKTDEIFSDEGVEIVVKIKKDDLPRFEMNVRDDFSDSAEFDLL